MSELNCEIFEIIRGTTHDGPGMRTTVFFKGCPLSCAWCQNPEGMKSGPGIWWDQRKCIHCLTCLETCTHGAVYEDASGLHRDLSKCQLCGDCVEECPAQAMTSTDQAWTLDKLFAEMLKDKEFFAAFKGGVTVSGGEPLRQFTFVTQFFKRLKEEGIHTALDTCGLASQAAFDAVLPYTDMVLYDIKLIDAQLHQHFTGQSNEIILKNLLSLAGFMREVNQARAADGAAPMKLWIRTPLIPDATATEENLAAIGGFIRDHLADLVERWELCTFNPACNSKYQKMDLTWAYADYPLMGEKDVNQMKAAALSSGLASEKLVVSGLVAQQLSS